MNPGRTLSGIVTPTNRTVNGVRYDTELDARRARLAKVRMRQAPTDLDYAGTKVMIGEGAYLWSVTDVNEDGSLELELPSTSAGKSQIRHKVRTRAVKFISKGGETLWSKGPR